MATKKAKRASAGVKKSNRLKKGSALNAVKPLQVSLSYGKANVTYSTQIRDSSGASAGLDTALQIPPPPK
jgi:hypothetical protein